MLEINNYAHNCSDFIFLYDEHTRLIKIVVLAGMLILVLVLKDSLRTFFRSLSLSWSLGSGPCPYPCPRGFGARRSLSLSWSLGVRSLSLSWSLWSSPCPCPCL